jgi:hypothetical protein
MSHGSQSARRNTIQIPPRPNRSSHQPSLGPSSSPTVPSNEHSELLEGTERTAVLEKLDSFVSEYREQKIPRSKALWNILELLEGNPSFLGLEKEKAVDLYIEELNSVRNVEDAGSERDLRTDRDIDNSVRQLLKEVSNGTRSRDELSDSESDEKPSSKRKKLKESDMPWFVPGESSYPSQSVSSKETCKSLRVFNRDISGCKFWIKLARGAPSGIPAPQWERIFKGEPIELNHFLSSLHRTSISEEGETRIGNAKISVGVADAKRHIGTAAEWSAAWHLATRAIGFVFPHRAEELRAYGDYIEGEFAAKISSSHSKIILFDIAVRNMVQGGQSILLTDQRQFLRLYSAIVMPDGIEYGSGKGANRRSDLQRATGSKSDVCNRFNTFTGCPSSDSDCKYRHICKNCKKGGHGKEQCPK